MLPSRGEIAFGVFLLVLCVASAVGCVLRREWWWAAASAGLVVFLAREVLGAVAERRYYRGR